MREACCTVVEKPGMAPRHASVLRHAQSRELVPDSARAKGSSIVDESGEC